MACPCHVSVVSLVLGHFQAPRKYIEIDIPEMLVAYKGHYEVDQQVDPTNHVHQAEQHAKKVGDADAFLPQSPYIKFLVLQRDVLVLQHVGHLVRAVFKIVVDQLEELKELNNAEKIGHQVAHHTEQKELIGLPGQIVIQPKHADLHLGLQRILKESHKDEP